MPIAIQCPGCSARLNAPDAVAGKQVKCPTCATAIPVPARGSAPAFEVVDDLPLPPVPIGSPGPSPTRWDEDEPLDRPRVRGRFRCPYCGSESRPTTRSKISTGGWVVFAALLFFCFPLFWIGLLMKEEYRVCSDCGTRIGGG